MILCTSCGTQNPDHAHACSNCKRKLQSRRSAPAPLNGTENGAPLPNGLNGNGTAALNGNGAAPPEPAWIALPQDERQPDEQAAHMVRSTAEVWIYAILLIGSAIATAWTQQWGWAAAGVALAAIVAKLRGL